MRSRRFAALTAVAVLAPLALGACGKPGRGEPSALAKPRFAPKSTPTVFPAPSPSAVPSAPASASAVPSASATGGGGGDGNAVQGTAANKFEPANLTVKAGTEVTWTLAGFHSVTGGKDGKADPASPMKSGLGVPTYKVKFDKAGTYPYFCTPHATIGMIGEIVVT